MEKGWRRKFKAALEGAAAKAGISLEGLEFDACTTDQTWGDRCGLVFYGAAPEVNERAAKFFEAWARKNLRKLGAVGGYETQESIGFAGEMYFTAYSNGAHGWYKMRKDTKLPAEGEKPYANLDLTCTKVRQGFATSYVYYPCAD